MGTRVMTLARIAEWRTDGGCGSISGEEGVERLPWLCALRAGHSGAHDAGNGVDTWADNLT
jgi:hypothetical protein